MKPRPNFSSNAKKVIGGQASVRRNYWEDPIYQFVARNHRFAQDKANAQEMARLSDLMQHLVNGTLSDTVRSELEGLRQAAERQAKAERKQNQRIPPKNVVKEETALAEVHKDALKRQIFHPQTSPDNMIRAFERLPTEEKRRTAAKLTKYLRSKIADYLAKNKL
ncbi:MAG: hypothetical protein WCW13_05415 [archaeon]|jgi:hypothetical protein